MSERRYVLDTNILISIILLASSIPQQAFDKVIAIGKILQSEATLEEIERVIMRSKFDKYLTRAEREIFLNKLKQDSLMIAVNITITDCRDPKDNKFLELALSGNANGIISGDNDLLVLHPFRTIPIVTPRFFLDNDV